MSVRLSVVLDRPGDGAGADPIATASRQLAAALIDAAPSGCVVDAIVPRDIEPDVVGLSQITRMRLGAQALRQAWAGGLAGSAARGMVHAPSLAAPLVAHDRANTGTHLVVTVWDAAWQRRGAGARLQRALLKRAERHADAIVVPTHALAAQVQEHFAVRERIRVIAGAPPTSFTVPSDELARRRDLALPAGYVLIDATAGAARLAGVLERLATLDAPLVVLNPDDAADPDIMQAVLSAGLESSLVSIRRGRDRGDRAVIFHAASVFVSDGDGDRWPWHALEAIAVGTPVVTVESANHREVLADAAVLLPRETFADGVVEAAGSVVASGERARIAASDRARSFSWEGAAEATWQLHAQL